MILVLNSGSSSLKFKLFGWDDLTPLASGMIENLGSKEARLSLKTGKQDLKKELPLFHHEEAIKLMDEALRESGLLKSFDELSAIGHRVVHGGERFREPVRITPQILQELENLVPLAPLHNPANLLGIRLALTKAPNLPQVAVFDTAFHQSLPNFAYLYALPLEIYQRYGVRRYGFHGISHAYVAKRAAAYLGRELSSLKLITLHLGNGASAAAIAQGQSVDTSMGFTPLEGLVMGTRSGDLDPAIIFYLVREHGFDLKGLEKMLNEKSGLKGLAGENDLRLLVQRAEAGDEAALLALEIFCYRLKKYIGAYLAALSGAHALVFTGGIGENSSWVRKKALEGLAFLGLELDQERNQVKSNRPHEVSSPKSRIKILVIPTDEEREIASETKEVVA